MDNTVKEPLIHLRKRGYGIWKEMAGKKLLQFSFHLLYVAGFIFMIIKMNPVEVYEGIVEGAVGTSAVSG